MNCTEAREAMLIADLDELRGEATTPLVQHIATCQSCTRLAVGLTGDARRLSSAISRRSRRLVALTVAIPIAAALLVVATLAPPDEPTPPRRLALDPPPPSRVISVDIAPGQRAAVLKTADPSVTLVWFTPGE